jgi:hypothetical protein
MRTEPTRKKSAALRILGWALGLVHLSPTRSARRANRTTNTSTNMNLLPVNEHPIERGLRIALGLGILSLAFVGPATPWGYLGLVPIATGMIGSCPLYTLLGFSTCKVQRPA